MSLRAGTTPRNAGAFYTPVEILLPRLDAVRKTGNSRWMARCPAHDDRTPSLSIKETEDQIILLHCFAGCPTGDVVGNLGLELKDLFPEGPVVHHAKGQPKPRKNPRNVLADVSHALVVVCLADSKLLRSEPLLTDEREALYQAIAALNKFLREARR